MSSGAFTSCLTEHVTSYLDSCSHLTYRGTFLKASRQITSRMWERTLQDLVRGLRANKKDEAKFIAKAVDEIRREIKTDDMELKAGAVLKLTYVR